MSDKKPIIIVGGGLAGLVAAYELTKQNVPVIIVDQENEANLGGQAFWSLGGIFCVDSADQRWNGVKDSRELAWADWLATAGFDREKEDHWPRRWAEEFVNFATDEMEPYLKGLGIKFLSVGWAERGSGSASGHGNSVPRFHLTWGIGPEIVRRFEKPVRAAADKGLVTFRFRHQVDELISDDQGTVIGVRGVELEPSSAERGAPSSRVAVNNFEISGSAVLVASGGVGGNLEAVRRNWPIDRLGPHVPKSFVIGVPAHVDGRMVDIAKSHGASVINMDRMWHYTEGLANWSPIWPSHGIRVIPGPSSLWLDATGKRFPAFLYPGCDTLATLRHICSTGYDYSWFVLNREIISREFSLSGSEQNPDIADKSYFQLLHRLVTKWGTWPVQNFMKHGQDFIVENNLEALVKGMNRLAAERDGPVLSLDDIRQEIENRDAQQDNSYTKDAQLMLIENTRKYGPDKRRVAPPHRLLSPAAGPLIAVRMNLLTRKSLGGLETDLSGNVISAKGKAIPGLYAAGEASGFGGGGMHGYSSLEGTFLGGCIFSGYTAGRALAERYTH